MGKIIDTVLETYAEGGTTFSCEFFPPKTDKGVVSLLAKIERLNLTMR